jgi:hypothetical protein
LTDLTDLSDFFTFDFMKNFYVWFLIWVARCGIALARGVNGGALLLLDAAERCLWGGVVPRVQPPRGKVQRGNSIEEWAEKAMKSCVKQMVCDGGPFDGHVLPFGGVVVILHDTGSGMVCAYERSAVDRYRFLRVVGRKGAWHE